MKGADARKAGTDGHNYPKPEDELETEDERDRATTASEHSDMETTDDGGASEDGLSRRAMRLFHCSSLSRIAWDVMGCFSRIARAVCAGIRVHVFMTV